MIASTTTALACDVPACHATTAHPGPPETARLLALRVGWSSSRTAANRPVTDTCPLHRASRV